MRYKCYKTGNVTLRSRYFQTQICQISPASFTLRITPAGSAADLSCPIWLPIGSEWHQETIQGFFKDQFSVHFDAQIRDFLR